MAVRKLLGDDIRLLPAKGGGHLVAHLQFQRAALIAGSVGSGGLLRVPMLGRTRSAFLCGAQERVILDPWAPSHNRTFGRKSGRGLQWNVPRDVAAED